MPTITLDRKPLILSAKDLAAPLTLGDALASVRAELANTGKVIVEVSVDGTSLDGPALSDSQKLPIADRTINIQTADQTQLARAMVGKLAALVEYLGSQHRAIAGLIEQNQTPKALGQLSGVLSAWQQIHTSYGSLAQLLQLNLDTLDVSGQSANALIKEFHTHLREIETALRNQDMVLLADILQYELDRTIEIWNSLLATTLGVIDGVLTPEGQAR